MKTHKGFASAQGRGGLMKTSKEFHPTFVDAKNIHDAEFWSIVRQLIATKTG